MSESFTDHAMTIFSAVTSLRKLSSSPGNIHGFGLSLCVPSTFFGFPEAIRRRHLASSSSHLSLCFFKSASAFGSHVSHIKGIWLSQSNLRITAWNEWWNIQWLDNKQALILSIHLPSVIPQLDIWLELEGEPPMLASQTTEHTQLVISLTWKLMWNRTHKVKVLMYLI